MIYTSLALPLLPLLFLWEGDALLVVPPAVWARGRHRLQLGKVRQQLWTQGGNGGGGWGRGGDGPPTHLAVSLGRRRCLENVRIFLSIPKTKKRHTEPTAVSRRINLLLYRMYIYVLLCSTTTAVQPHVHFHLPSPTAVATGCRTHSSASPANMGVLPYCCCCAILLHA